MPTTALLVASDDASMSATTVQITGEPTGGTTYAQSTVSRRGQRLNQHDGWLHQQPWRPWSPILMLWRDSAHGYAGYCRFPPNLYHFVVALEQVTVATLTVRRVAALGDFNSIT
jgi:hypothetical protein